MITLPSLTHLDISDSPGDCALALAHLDMPALTSLCLTIYHLPDGSNMQKLLPYLARHAQGPQDTQPLQSVLIYHNGERLHILAWPVPDIDVRVQDPPAFLGATLPTRVALAFESKHGSHAHSQVLEMVMAALPLDGLLTLAAQCKDEDVLDQQFWLRRSPKWPLLRRVRLDRQADQAFIEVLLEDNGVHENPLLPSLKVLALINVDVYEVLELPLCAALTKRVKQGVPLETLDLRFCYPDPNRGAAVVQLFSGIAIDVLGPEEILEARIAFDWYASSLFIKDDTFGEG
ncbi:hypothetical protein EI94DRAFT_814203 [Lactarius quietus]|nr:hypothetical protein EI94DRAFT_814203 [Lactarius quietus]